MDESSGTFTGFLCKYFNGKSNEKYVNSKKGFASYFVSFESGPALEIMQRQDITEAYDKDHIGLAHLPFMRIRRSKWIK